jgi:hypothetical protein
VTRYDDVLGEKIETPIPLVVVGVTEEEGVSGARHKFVGSSGGDVGIAWATKDLKVHMGQYGAEEGEEGSGLSDCLRGEAVE